MLAVSNLVEAETKTYGLVHIGMTKEASSSELLTDRVSYFGLKGVKQLTGEFLATYKFELGVDITSHSIINQPRLNYSFVGLKSNYAELRLGLQDSAYDIVDNSMESFLTWQGNGLVTENSSSNIIAIIKKVGLFGFYATHTPSSGDDKPSSSIMVNYASGPIYLGLGLKKEQGSQKKTGVKMVVTYKNNNYAIGYIHEKCPSNQYAAEIKPTNGKCTGNGEGNIDHLSAIYSFGKPYVAAQIARNSYLGINKHTLEIGAALSKDTRAYIELDRVGSLKATTLGLKTRF